MIIASVLDQWYLNLPIWLHLLIVIVGFVLSSCVTVHVVLWKRDVRAVIAWVGVAWLAPYLGAMLYLGFGVNRIRRKATSLGIREDGENELHARIANLTCDQPKAAFEQFPEYGGLIQACNRLVNFELVPGNQIEPLLDGDNAFPAMLQAIEQAQSSITLISYIFDYDRVGRQFLQALTDAKQRGVQVRVLVDDVGARYTRPNIVRQLIRNGVTAASFLPTKIRRIPITSNLRNHRKIMVVDGKLGFTGGTNIREGHSLKLNAKAPIQCLHFKLTGPIVSQLQTVFCRDWEFTTDEVLSGDVWFPPIAEDGPVWARGIEDGPDENFEKLVDIIAAALACSKKRVRIATPYFLPRSSLIEALNVTALRGVDVEIYLPEVNNIPLIHWATEAQLWQNLEKGCRCFYTPKPFDHTKLMLVDDVWALIGSTNWDPRSLRLNFEFNVECYDRKLVASLHDTLDKKTKNAREITLEEMDNRSIPRRLRDGLARLWSPYL